MRIDLNKIDQRYYQIAFLFSLFLYAKFYLYLPHMKWWYIFLVISSTQIFQFYFSQIFKLKFDWRSSLISSLAITILLATNSWQAAIFCTFFTIASKFLIRYNEKHIFNPNNFSIVLTLFMFPSIAKVAPYQWGLESWSFAIFIIIVGFLISRSVRSYDLAIYFLSLYSFSMFIFSFMGLYNGNLFLHIMSIPITLFSFFMITDPKVIPNTTEGRFIFAVITVTISNILYIFTNLTPPFIFALPVSSLITPLIDSYFLGKNFQWNK
jgi:Na+-transporting NADH:ubiquinone oxidoreductase subunit NqrB